MVWFLDQLDEQSVVPFRVDEGNHVAAAPEPRRFVDQRNAFRFQLGQRAFEIIDLVRDVMQAGAFPGEELADRRVRARCPEQLQVGLTDRKHRFLDALVLDALTVRHLDAPYVGVVLDRSLEIFYRDRDVFDLS
jgi:hypothetical protein